MISGFRLSDFSNFNQWSFIITVAIAGKMLFYIKYIQFILIFFAKI